MTDLTGQWAAVVGHGRALRERADLLIHALRGTGLVVGGALQAAVESDSEEPAAWDLVDVDTGARAEMAFRSLDPDVCGWGFHEEAFAREAEWLARKPYDVVLLEAARLEARHLGHWPSIAASMQAAHQLPIVLLRPRALAALVLELPTPDMSLEIPCAEDTLRSFASDVASCFGRGT